MSQPPFIVLNPDGSWTRLLSFPTSLPTPDQDSDTTVLSKDLAINDVKQTWVRLHILKETLCDTRTLAKKLPLIVYYHGGGFVLTTAATTITHDLCDRLAEGIPAVVVNVDYRHAPEHRLPAAYEDAMEALHWIKTTQDPWLTTFADLSNCYLMGTSSGGNIAYHVGLRVSKQIQDLEPLKIKGLILHSMYLGGVKRTESEIRLADAGPLSSLSKCDKMWDLSLPVNAGRDHEYCNLILGSSDNMGRIKDMGWQVMVIGRYGDLLIDRQMEFAKTLELNGVDTTSFYGDGAHVIDMFDKSKAEELIGKLSCFFSSINRLNVKDTK